MNGPDRSPAAIEQQNWYAVSGTHTNALSHLIRDESITFPLAFLNTVCIDNLIRMNLLERNFGLRIT